MVTLIKQAYLLGLSDEIADAIPSSTEGSYGSLRKGDVLIEDGQVVAIAPTLQNVPEHTEVIDATGQFLGPGLVDLYSQSGEPGHESRETRQSLSQAASAGGFTRVGLLPNTQPAIDNAAAIVAAKSFARTDHKDRAETDRTADGKSAQSMLMPWGSITLGVQGQQLTDLAELADAGALGFTDAQPIANPVLLRRLLEYAQPLNKPIALWPCDLALAGDGIAREGPDALRLGLRGTSAIAQTSAISTICECVATIRTPVHLMRIATARGVDLIRRAKAEGLPVTASVPWHHLVRDTKDLEHYDPNLRHNPPLGTPGDRQALIAGVAEGVIDAIAIDHSPYTYEENTVAFESAPPGAIGLEISLPVLWQTFVSSGQWQPEQLWQMLSQSPRRCLGLTPAFMASNTAAELTLFNPVESWQATAHNLHSLSSNTAWLDQPMTGKVTRLWMSELSS